ncbi:hypothetical protein HO572_11235 [Streptococcus suis]|uniref:hypothetical protein n=1 Tax=Streptococcus suis TaxID=1307 RepID=UPI00155543A7|nr:hypothetical protein [Streptococcus suis]MCB2944723.1 hypothetical protein [Streptococcus suis]MCB2952641.1 hypothetical protein [Streptococcus suis]MCK3876472.1 hypothetical protein [Streptococcus suis]NQI91800.1 hypothetical protein [Streptococcus suis]NQI98180.1 hypothetical protein [Streptococcus suis]
MALNLATFYIDFQNILFAASGKEDISLEIIKEAQIFGESIEKIPKYVVFGSKEALDQLEADLQELEQRYISQQKPGKKPYSIRRSRIPSASSISLSITPTHKTITTSIEDMIHQFEQKLEFDLEMCGDDEKERQKVLDELGKQLDNVKAVLSSYNPKLAISYAFFSGSGYKLRYYDEISEKRQSVSVNNLVMFETVPQRIVGRTKRAKRSDTKTIIAQFGSSSIFEPLKIEFAEYQKLKKKKKG